MNLFVGFESGMMISQSLRPKQQDLLIKTGFFPYSFHKSKITSIQSLFHECKEFVSVDNENVVIWQFENDFPLKVLYFGFAIDNIALLSSDSEITGILANTG